MPTTRLSDILAAMPRDRAVVIDIDADVEAVAVPGSIIALIETAFPADHHDRVRQIVALLIARLGPDTAVPEIRGWLASRPAIFDDVSDDLLDILRNRPDEIGPLLGKS
jgi:hypothetical protein